MELRTTSLQGALPWAQRRWRWRWRAGPPPWPARRPDCRRAPAPIARLCSPLLAAALLAAALPVTALPARTLAAEPPLRAAPGQVPLAAPAPLPAQAPTAGEGAPAGTEDEGEGLPGALARSRELVAGQSFLLGLSVQTAKLELYRGEPFADGHGPSAKLTNNRELEAIARYTTAETYLREYPMRVGWFRVGYDFELSTTGFRTDRQETRNVIEGEALGTTSSGRLLGTGPMVFVRLGPLYPGGRIFWKGGGGAGIGLIEFEADVLFRNNLSAETSRESLTHRSRSPNLYVYGLWMLEWGNWQLVYLERNLRGKTDFGTYLFKESSTVLGYTLRF